MQRATPAHTLEQERRCVHQSCLSAVKTMVFYRHRRIMAFPTHLSFLLLVCSFILVGVSSCFHSGYRINKNASKFNQLDKIAIRDHDFVDKQGRRRLFHGINSVLKYPPWYPEWLLNDTKLQYLNDWGFNVVRLGVMWSGVQPVCNFTNQTYLNKLQEIVSKLQSHGIYVI